MVKFLIQAFFIEHLWSTLKLPLEGLTDNFNRTLGNSIKFVISLIMEGLLEEVPRSELNFALKQRLWGSLGNKFKHYFGQF